MPAGPLVIVCDMDLPEAARALLAAGVGAHRLLMAPRGDAAALAAADVAFGQPDAEGCAASARLGWAHLSSAGYTAFDRPVIRAALSGRGAALTTSSLVYDEPCAQHVLAFMLAEARQLAGAFRNQLEARAWPSQAIRAASRLLCDQTVVLLGMGAIARRLVELLAPLRLQIVGVRRRPRGDEPVPTVPLADLDTHLARADHVVSTLPASDETLRLFDAARFAALRAGAVFYNIGRGSTIDQQALLGALASGRLRAAYLDVTDPEPLPPDHPLWRAPGCFITPHAAGGHAGEPERLVRHFLENLRRYGEGLPLRDRVI
jgi:phosphoglycerate dehydrogenase-like enzyme